MNKLLTSIILIAGLFIISAISAQLIKQHQPQTVAIIEITGPLTTGHQNTFFATGTSSTTIVELIQEADRSDEYAAIVIEIDSPGGSPVASDEIAQALAKTHKPTVALIRETGASGAYWIASATDHIIANRMSMTGSIGVIGSYLDFSGFLADHNITYQRLTAGEYKDTGTPLRALTENEQALLQKKIDHLHDIFIETIVQNRNISKEHVEELATGMFYFGDEALALGLVDELGGLDEVSAYLNRTENIQAKYERLTAHTSLLDYFAGTLSEAGYSTGKGIGSTLLERQVSV